VLVIKLIPVEEFKRINNAQIEKWDSLQIIADMCRANALATVKRAGSGHLGSSFSSLDIVTMLYYDVMNTIQVGTDHVDRDIYFSSKGHDVPGHYAVLYSMGIIPENMFINLRRLGGTHGHPDVSVPGIETNSGSLGMGISKAKGMALAKKIAGNGGRIFVMTGDGELQEGQIWEALQTTLHQQINNVNVIVDFNKIQTDKATKEIIDIGDLENKFEIFGWHVERASGHDFEELDRIFKRFKEIEDKPKALIADTVKGKGISFMEGPRALKDGQGLYRWHSGAPGDEYFEAGYGELISRINGRLNELGLEPLSLQHIDTKEKGRVKLKDTAEKVVNAYGKALVESARSRKDVIVLDADLSADCGLRLFEKEFPERFVENGIAEQDMVSTAGGLALQGFLPVVNSFASFLASRANEQIYTNATEGTKIIYVCHYAGLIPAGPGKSHQSVRDISLFAALPNCTILQPCNAIETKLALEYCINDSDTSCMLRLPIGPSPRTIELPEDYRLVPGRGVCLTEGKDAVIFAYGPVMLNESLGAAEILFEKGFGLKVVNMPWLNSVDKKWLITTIGTVNSVFVLEDHSPIGGLGGFLLNKFGSLGLSDSKSFEIFGVQGFPACGTPLEALRYHDLDSTSLTKRIRRKRKLSRPTTTKVEEKAWA